jgi:hypothetical protein
VVSAREYGSYKVKLDNAVRKERLLRRIAVAAANHAKLQNDRVKTLVERGAASTQELQETEGRLEILNSILETEGSGDAKPAVPAGTPVPATSATEPPKTPGAGNRDTPRGM